MTIDFELTDKLQMIQDGVRGIAKTLVRPLSLEMDRTHSVPDSLMFELQRLGASQGGVPKEFGGEGDGVGEPESPKKRGTANMLATIGAEELAWGDVTVLMNLPGPGLGGPPVRSHGTREQQQRFFGMFKDTSVLRWGAYGLTEPGAGSDVSAIRTSCRKDGHHWVLNGRKCYITNGAKASWVSIFATLDPTLGRAGQRVFVVEKGTPGFSVGKLEEKLGLRASETAELVLEDCRVHEDNLLGGEARYGEGAKEGFVAAMKTFDASRPVVGVMAVGIGRAAYELARDLVVDRYVLTRPVPRYRVIADRLARTKRRLDAARALCWRASWMADQGLPNAKEASMAKAAGGQAGVAACIDALEIVGAHGTLEDGDQALLAKWFRDIKVFDIFEGTGQIQRIVISKRIFEGLKGF